MASRIAGGQMGFFINRTTGQSNWRKVKFASQFALSTIVNSRRTGVRDAALKSHELMRETRAGPPGPWVYCRERLSHHDSDPELVSDRCDK